MKIDYRPFKKMEPISQLKYFFEIYQLPELEELQKILAINTKDWNRDIFMNIFDTIFAKAKKEWSEINEYFEKKHNKFSDDDKKISLFHKALELDNQGKYHEAIKFYKQHIQNKTSTSALFNLGLIYEENLNNPQEAIKYYKLVLNHKKDTSAMTRLGLLYLNFDFEDIFLLS